MYSIISYQLMVVIGLAVIVFAIVLVASMWRRE